MENIAGRRFMSIIIMLVVLISGFCMSLQPSYAATVKTIPSTTTVVANANKLKLSKNNYTVTWNIDKHKIKTGAGSEKILCIPIKDYDSSWTVTNFAKLTFTNVGKINGRQIDCTVNFDSMTVTARKGESDGETSDGYMGFASIWGAADGLQTGVTISDGCGYRAKKTVKYTVNVYYSDTKKTVNLPFFQKVCDIDAGNTYFREAWESKSGYTGTYYKYSTNYNTFSGDKVLAPSGGDQVSGNDEMLKAGIYAPTVNGKFTAVFTEGNSGTLINIYSPYTDTPKVFVPPTKSVNKTSAQTGETVTYKVVHTMGTFYETTMSVYDRFEFSDVLPEELEFKSLVVTNGAGKNITSSGSYTYDEDTHKLLFKMGSSWKNNTANYSGQKITFTVKTEVADFDGWTATAENIGEIILADELTVATNEVETDLYKIPVIQIVKKLPAGHVNDEGHGNSTFLFKITGDTSGDTWYRTVTIYDDGVSNDWNFSKSNGVITATGPMEEFPAGETYSISEIDVGRYELVNTTVYEEGTFKRATFENKKKSWQYYNHNSIVINELAGGGDSVE